MAVAKMKLVNIVGRLKDFDSVVQQCCIKGNFHPEQSSQAVSNMEEFAPIEEQNPYVRTLQKITDVAVHSQIGLKYSDFSSLSMTRGQFEAYIERIDSEVGTLNGKLRTLDTNAARLEQGLTQLSHLKNFDLSLDDLKSCKNVTFNFGRLPEESFPKLDAHENSDELFFFPLEQDNGYYWGFYVTHKKGSESVDEIFNSLYFERVSLVGEAHGKPAEAVASVTSLLKDIKKQQAEARRQIEEYWEKESHDFLRVYSNVRYLNDSFDLRRYAVKCRDSFYIFGWVPEEEIDVFSKQFDHLSYVDCIVENTEDAQDVQPPTSLVNKKAFRPFESFVDMYGLPAYNEIDPTPFLAFSYTLFFGIMFADLGQGALIALLGLFLSIKKKMSFGGILTRVGISSMIFGTLFGSVFGFEEVIPALIPVHDNQYIQVVLFSAIGLGVLTILFCMGLNIANAIRQRDAGKLLFSHNGISGLVFYSSVILAFVLLMLFQKNIVSPLFIVFLVLLPLILMFLKEPLSHLIERRKDWIPQNKVEFALQSFFEMFEVLLSYATNTISFIRVGAYILSHAGMMFAVFAIASMGGGGNNPIVVIIGNLFVICLEGLIVGIQGIRLQFYEMFSRFFDGSGKPYTPAKVKY